MIDVKSTKTTAYTCALASTMRNPKEPFLSGRKGIGIELPPQYFFDGVGYCHLAEEKVRTPSLFDVIDDLEAA